MLEMYRLTGYTGIDWKSNKNLIRMLENYGHFNILTSADPVGESQDGIPKWKKNIFSLRFKQKPSFCLS